MMGTNQPSHSFGRLDEPSDEITPNEQQGVEPSSSHYVYRQLQTPADNTITSSISSERKDTTADRLFRQAADLHAGNKLVAAFALYMQAIEECKDIATLATQGNALFLLANFKAALACYKRALTIDPRHPDLLRNTGSTLHYIADQLLVNSNKATSSENAEATYQSILKTYQEALMYYQNSLSIDPNNANTLFNYGVTVTALFKLDQEYKKPALPSILKEANDYLSQAIKLDSKHTLAMRQRADNFACLEQYNEAANDYEKLLILKPKDNDAKFNLLLCRQKIAENPSASESVEETSASPSRCSIM
jgi:tetratricopeptide (TPR) repeat protein